MGIRDFFGRRAARAEGTQDMEPAQPPEPGSPEDLASSLAREQIRPGFRDRVDVVEIVREMLDEAGVEDADALAATVTDRAWTERAAELASDQGRDDNARLESAFERMRSEGIVAEMDFTCCQTCGHDEISDMRRGEERGYVFFHEQDSERLVDSPAQLYLAFGSFVRGDDPAAIVESELATAQAAVAAVRAEGLHVDWSGTVDARPVITIEDWRRPLPA